MLPSLLFAVGLEYSQTSIFVSCLHHLSMVQIICQPNPFANIANLHCWHQRPWDRYHERMLWRRLFLLAMTRALVEASTFNLQQSSLLVWSWSPIRMLVKWYIDVLEVGLGSRMVALAHERWGVSTKSLRHRYHEKVQWSKHPQMAMTGASLKLNWNILHVEA